MHARYAKILVGKSEGKTQLERHRRRRKDINMQLKEKGCEVMDWTKQPEITIQWLCSVNIEMISTTVGNFLISCAAVNF
jgi:hypothetical protein